MSILSRSDVQLIVRVAKSSQPFLKLRLPDSLGAAPNTRIGVAGY